jgi:protein TonB
MKISGAGASLGLLLSLCLAPAIAQVSAAGPEPPNYDTPPILIHQELARYTAAARDANISGKVTLLLTVDVNGRATHVRVLHGLGIGLDEGAVVAVRQDRFKPAMKDGHPVLAEIKLDIIYDPAVNPGP